MRFQTPLEKTKIQHADFEIIISFRLTPRMGLKAKPNVIKILLRNPHLNNFYKSTLALTSV